MNFLPALDEVFSGFLFGLFVFVAVPSGDGCKWPGDAYVVLMDGSCAWWVSYKSRSSL